MRVFFLYTILMNLSFENLLFSHAILGVLWLTLLFGLCFFGVHIARLVRFGWLYQQKQETEQPKDEKEKNEKKETAPQPKPSAEPVYYIVERKRKRTARPSYGEPKEIRFK